MDITRTSRKGWCGSTGLSLILGIEMKISEVIAALESAQRELGDVELYSQVNDGRSTFAEKVNAKVVYTAIWAGHSQGKRNFLRT